jgi:hypothetical protein
VSAALALDIGAATVLTVHHAVVTDWSQNGHGFFRTGQYRASPDEQGTGTKAGLTCIY